MDLETKPQVDRLRCWRERPVAAGTSPNSDPPIIVVPRQMPGLYKFEFEFPPGCASARFHGKNECRLKKKPKASSMQASVCPGRAAGVFRRAFELHAQGSRKVCHRRRARRGGTTSDSRSSKIYHCES